MKTFGKILLIILLSLVVVHLFPVLMLPVVVGVAGILAIGTLLVGGIATLLATVVSLVAGVLAVVLVALAVLSPLWLPALAIYGIVCLCRRTPKATA